MSVSESGDITDPAAMMPQVQAYTKQKLGELKKIEDIRSIWPDEAQYFTPWLAQQLDLLGGTIGLDLVFEAMEKWVGPFRADILCRDSTTSHWVLIENQFEKTDHSHLGQLITYAAGLDALTIVWVAEHFTEEHRAALDWLNRVTDESVNFFGLELELWRIGDSMPAPKFNVVSQPNDWSKTVATAAQGELSETARQQQDFWQRFRTYASANSKVIRPQKASPTHWMDFSIGRSDFFLGARLNSLKKVMSVGLFINHKSAKAMFKALYEQRNEIEKEFGEVLNWVENPAKKQSKVELILDPADMTQADKWSAQQEWMLARLEKLHKVFAQRIRQLPSQFPEDEL